MITNHDFDGNDAMKIAITATQPSLDAAVDPRFGRCPYFLIVETDDLAWEAVENPNAMLGSGAGIQSAQSMAAKGVRFVLTGNCGPNAYETLSAAGIQVILRCSGMVRDVVEQFKTGQLNPAMAANVAGHSGTAGVAPNDRAASSQETAATDVGRQPPMTGQAVGRGRGMGRGAGRGRGGGRGLGWGCGGGSQTWPPAPIPAEYCRPAQSQNKEQELRALKQRAEAMEHQMLEIRQRIHQLEREEQTQGGSGDAAGGAPSDDAP